MEYLNDRTYARGEEVALTVAVESKAATAGGRRAYQATVVDFLGPSGHKIRLWGTAPEVGDNNATVTLAGKVGNVEDGVYRNLDGVLGSVPGDTVKWESMFTLQRPLKIVGDAEARESEGNGRD